VVHCNDSGNGIAGFPVPIHHSYAGLPSNGVVSSEGKRGGLEDFDKKQQKSLNWRNKLLFKGNDVALDL